MPSLNFKSKFVDEIRSRAKRQTIRQVRKHPIRPGDTLYLYTGMRTAHCSKIADAVCESVSPIEIRAEGMSLDDADMLEWEQVQMARDDGFENVAEFRAFFERQYGLPFSGVVIYFRIQHSARKP